MSIVCEKSELLGEDEEVREGERECVVEGKGSTKMPDGGGGMSILAKLYSLQRALDATNASTEHEEWSGILRTVAGEVTARVEAMIDRNTAEWEKVGVLPEGCEVGSWLEAKV